MGVDRVPTFGLPKASGLGNLTRCEGHHCLPNPKLLIPIFFMPNPILFPVPNSFEPDTYTFFYTKIFEANTGTIKKMEKYCQKSPLVGTGI